jgi:hypothetical protein
MPGNFGIASQILVTVELVSLFLFIYALGWNGTKPTITPLLFTGLL